MAGLEQRPIWPRASHTDWVATVRDDLDGTEPDRLRTPIDDGVAFEPLFWSAPAPGSTQPAATHTKFRATTLRLAVRADHAAPRDPRSADQLLPEGFDLRREIDPALQRTLAGGEAEAVRRLDPAHTVLTLAPDAVGARALATLERTGLPHLVVLDVVDHAFDDGTDAAPAGELAMMLAAVVDVLRGFDDDARARPKALAGRLLLPLRLGCDLVTEIAKIRAASWLWHSVTTAFGLDPDRVPARVWARASDACFSGIDPEINLVRGALQMFAAATADCFAFEPLLHDPVGDRAGSLRLAANQFRLLRHEAEAQRVHDPAAGAFAIESLTAQIATAAWRLLQAIESQGGARQTRGGRDVISAGIPHERVLVGTNRFADPSARVAAAPAAAMARPATPYEVLRRRTAGRSIAAVVLPFGEAGLARPQTEWAVDFLRTAGIEPQLAPACASLTEAGHEITRHGQAQLLVCAGIDDASGTFVRGVRALLGNRTHLPLLYATGKPPPDSATWGAVGFLHRELDAVGTLSGILDRLGVG